ncbi:MAG TPA: DUF5686 family protein [Bacteroidia bacterium]|nr:DUF5686 family protein [Bacteroidia bacterium]
MLRRKHIFAEFLVLFLGLVPFITWSQETIITGKIYDAQTREAMPFVNIILQNTTVGGTTDIDGNFKIETNVKSDSLLVSYVGYKPTAKAIKNHQTQQINIFLESESTDLGEVVVHAGENPAWRILRKIMDHKNQNDPSYLDAYQYELYNKIEFDLNNIPKTSEKKKIFKSVNFMFNYIDSSNVKEKPYLPVFISEALSDYYYRNAPRVKDEIIKGTKFSGFKNQSVSQFMGDMYQNVDIYKNSFLLFGQEFNSPITNNWNLFYKYYLIDSTYLNGHRCYQIQFKPKHRQEFAFTGNMWITDTSFAVERLEMTMPSDVNLNFVQTFNVIQEFELVNNKYWMMTKNRLVIDFALGKNKLGMYGRKTATYGNFVINQPKDAKFYSITNNLQVEDSAADRSTKFWDSARHEPLSKQERNIYKMVDSIQTLPIYNHAYHALILIFTGYRTFGNFDIGPVANFISYNTVEGTRIRFGGRTSDKFSEWYELSGYTAYGFQDKKVKYNIGFKSFITRKPWQQIEMHYTDDLQILGRSDNLFGSDNFLTSILARSPVSNLTRVQETKFTYDRDWFPGLEIKLSLLDRVFTPLNNVGYSYYNPYGELLNKPFINEPAFQAYVNFSYDDKYIESSMSRTDVGTRYPTVILQYTAGFKGILQGDYQYHKVVFGLSEILHINPFGDTHYYIEVGKIYGVVPYPLMQLHPGNETYVYDATAYNLMNYYEFASDRYFALNIEHHFEGYFFNKVPLFRKLKWREIAGCKFLIGSVNPENEKALLFPSTLSSLNGGVPYSEADLGIENILKVIRIDALWRLSYLNSPNISRFGIMGSFQFIF